MARVKLQLPSHFAFTCDIPVRITDINYGGHVGNDTLLTLIHEARMQYLGSLGYTEMDFGGTGMIMAEVTIEFKSELFYGEVLMASVAAGEISRYGFDLFYKLEKESSAKRLTVAHAKTAMICYDYSAKKIISLPGEAKNKLAPGKR